MASIQVPAEAIGVWNGTEFKQQITPTDFSLIRHLTEDICLLTDEFLSWAKKTIPTANLVVVYVSGEGDTFEVHGSDDDIMLVRLKWYNGIPVPPKKELPDNLYVTAPYEYHMEQVTIPKEYRMLQGARSLV